MPRTAWKPVSVGSANGSRNDGDPRHPVRRQPDHDRDERRRRSRRTRRSTAAACPPAHSSPTRTRPRLTTAAEVRLEDQQQRQHARTPAATGHQQRASWSGTARAAPARARPTARTPAWPARRAAGARRPRSNHCRAPLIRMPIPGTSTSSSRKHDDEQGDRRPPADDARPAAAARPASRPRRAPPRRPAARPAPRPARAASAASIEEAENTMTSPMASSRPGRAEHQVAAGHRPVQPGRAAEPRRRSGAAGAAAGRDGRRGRVDGGRGGRVHRGQPRARDGVGEGAARGGRSRGTRPSTRRPGRAARCRPGRASSAAAATTRAIVASASTRPVHPRHRRRSATVDHWDRRGVSRQRCGDHGPGRGPGGPRRPAARRPRRPADRRRRP